MEAGRYLRGGLPRLRQGCRDLLARLQAYGDTVPLLVLMHCLDCPVQAGIACCFFGYDFYPVRVQGDAVQASEPITAGPAGTELFVTYDPPNVGISAHMTATIVNQTEETFEHALVKFRVPADSLPCAVEGGELKQTVVEGDVAVCYARVAVPPMGTATVTIEPVPVTLPNGAIALLKQNYPNPARAGTTIRFVLAFPAEVRIDVYDIAGRRVRTLRDEEYLPGEYEVPWDLRNEDGLGVASGIYLYRLQAGGESITKKLAVIK